MQKVFDTIYGKEFVSFETVQQMRELIEEKYQAFELEAIDSHSSEP